MTMHTLLIVACLLGCLGSFETIGASLPAAQAEGAEPGFSFADHADRIDIFFGQQRIATYLKDHPQLTRRALINVTTPNGFQVTRNFPPRLPEDRDPDYTGEGGIIHPHMHPGIWISFGELDGNDYWRLKAPVKFDGFVEGPQATARSCGFTTRNQYHSQDGSRVVCVETARYTWQRVEAGLVLGIELRFESNEQDFYFGDQEESGLAFRVASPLRVTGGKGAIRNERGDRNGAEIWGKPALWCDYSGPIDDRLVGLLAVPNPANPRPSWAHARDYGLLALNPFPKQPQERREPYVKTWVKRDQPFELSYALLIYDVPLDEGLDRDQAYRSLLSTFESSSSRGQGEN